MTETRTIRAGKRIYYIDIKQTKGDDKYIVVTESKKLSDGEYERHRIMLYKEDFDKFLEALHEAVEDIKCQ